MDLITKRALQIFDYALENNLAGNKGDLCKKIGLPAPSLTHIKTVEGRTFNNQQLQQLAKLTKVNMNWIFGLSNNMFREEKESDPLEKIRQAVTQLETEKNQRKKKT